MQKYYPLLVILSFWVTNVWAQPSNDECENPIPIIDVSDFCSAVGEYTNVGATNSGYGPANCFGSASNDVWFSFTPIATDVTITVIGNVGGGASGGTLSQPEIALYTGVCGGTINEEECAAGGNSPELYKGGLAIGETYYIRVQGRNGATGTFELCLNNYNPPVEPGSDCFIASILCNKDPFVVQSVVGAGSDPTEANDAPCLGSFGGNVESNSTWFTWTAATNGSLTFTLTPIIANDDLDFVLYELPADPLDCADKTVIRCMASGDFNFPSPCMGPTGLSETAEDLEEPPGCNNPQPQDNFLAALQMTAGTTYALMINNFTSAGNGFKIEFGGTGEFVGPEAAFSVSDPDQTICLDEPISFSDISNFAFGDITDWEWDFGQDATPQTATGPGPHDVTYSSPGEKFVIMTITTDRGCIETEIRAITVECCSDHFTLDADVSDVLCADDPSGAIDLIVESNFPDYMFEWSNTATTEDINNLEVGEYTVTITDMATCDTVFTVMVGGPDTIDVDTLIMMPTCNGGMDGAITLEVMGATPPFEYNWGGAGFIPENTISNLPIGDYDVIIRDANGCELSLVIPVRELELVLDPTINAITIPSCNGGTDGVIEAIIANGLPPYEYDWNDGNGFVTSNRLENIPSGIYTLNVRDANLCVGSFEFVLNDNSPVELILETLDVSCFGETDGTASAQGQGGVGDYTIQWSNGQFGPEVTDLAPGSYSITLSDANNCNVFQLFTIAEPDPVFVEVLATEDLICNGVPEGAITVGGIGGVTPYEFSVDGINFQTDPRFDGLAAGTYEFTIMDARGCTSTITGSIIEPDPLIVDAGPDQTVDLGNSANIQAATNYGPVTYAWLPPENLTCTDCPTPMARPIISTTYIVTAIDENNCTATDSIQINVSENYPVFIPNVFSPDADGVNDAFTVFGGLGASQVVKMQVFDRWGSLVFENENFPLNEELFGWNGTYEGEKLKPAVFVYIVEVEFIDNTRILFEGDIALIR